MGLPWSVRRGARVGAADGAADGAAGVLAVVPAVVLAVALAGVAGPVPAAGAHPAEAVTAHRAAVPHLSGTIAFEQVAAPEYPAGAGATWSVDGDALALLQEASLLGITDTTGWFDSAATYAHAALTGFHVPAQVFPCLDPGGPTTTRDFPGIADADAAVSILEVEVDLLTGKGAMRVNLAESPSNGHEMLASGTVLLHQHSDCYDPATDSTTSVPVMGEGSAPLSSWWPLSDGYANWWRMTRNPAGEWVVDATRTFGHEAYDRATETMHLTLRGSLLPLHAACALPTVRRLHPLSTFRQADRLAAAAGFRGFVHQAKASRAAPRGHFFITEGIGEKYAACGRRHLHIVRSLGWP